MVRPQSRIAIGLKLYSDRLALITPTAHTLWMKQGLYVMTDFVRYHIGQREVSLSSKTLEILHET
jgi:hypothetical protein